MRGARAEVPRPGTSQSAAVTQCCTAPFRVLAKPRFPWGYGRFPCAAEKVPSIPRAWGHREGGSEPAGCHKNRRGRAISVAGEDGIVSGMAGRYATALFELALESKAVDQVQSDLKAFDALIASSQDLTRRSEEHTS